MNKRHVGAPACAALTTALQSVQGDGMCALARDGALTLLLRLRLL